MIVEDYISFETAKLLKEKGFDEYCFCISHPTEEGHYNIIVQNLLSNSMIPFTSEYKFCRYKEDFITIPTIQMAVKWLRKVHNLFIAFELDFSDGAYPMFDAVVYNLATCEKYPIINYDRYSYIKGTEAAIKYCLEHLI